MCNTTFYAHDLQREQIKPKGNKTQSGIMGNTTLRKNNIDEENSTTCTTKKPSVLYSQSMK